MSPTPQIISDVMGIGADIEPLAANNLEINLGRLHIKNLMGVDVDEAGFALDGLSLTSQLVERHPVFLDRRNHGRSLVKVTVVLGKGRFDLIG